MKNTTELRKMSLTELANLFNVKVPKSDTLTAAQISAFYAN
jgi:hypothetical protein